MSQVTSGLYAVLSSPYVYTSFQYLMGARSGWRRFVGEYVRPFPGAVLLDIGCGPADILDYLPDVDYWGFDISQAYIDRATRKFGNRGHFVCKLLTEADLDRLPKFDVVTASGVLHHMDDGVARQFLSLARRALKPGGRLVTVDPCLVEGQNPIARFLIERDRGQNVRTEAGYASLARSEFPDVRLEIRHKTWIPYTHGYMECRTAAASSVEKKGAE
ncbi:MAG: hypothetical protein ABS91_00730 [Thiobacillus sp. SCN 64-35]|nr:MAG: hypothetical protein ABS91_00730 [Thiobacillus sp. SCN 64-35]